MGFKHVLFLVVYINKGFIDTYMDDIIHLMRGNLKVTQS